MHEFDLILTLAAALTAALLLGYITQRLSLSPIVGYLLAGIAVGPATPGFVADKYSADQMAEIGVILLMFGVGLHFQVKDLLAVRRVAIPGALGQSLVATLLGCLAGWAFGWTWSAGILFGLAVSVASTVVLFACSRTTTICTRPRATSRWVGWSSKTCSRCSCWFCFRS